MNVAELLTSRALSCGDTPAIVQLGDQPVTFSELDAAACAFAAQLSESGVGAGQTALVFAPMSAGLYAVLAALW